MKQRGRGRVGAGLLFALAALQPAGCDGPIASAPAPSSACTKIGAKCQLPAGPLGVCQQIPCSGGEKPPCFDCTPQH